MRFSERHGYKQPRAEIQLERVDDDLTNGLWNCLYWHYWSLGKWWSPTLELELEIDSLSDDLRLEMLVTKIWVDHLKRTNDTLSNDWPEILSELRNYFFSCEWFEKIDFIEFIASAEVVPTEEQELDDKQLKLRANFVADCNHILKQEMSAYRFVDNQIAQMTNEEEIVAIEDALRIPDRFASVRRHISDGLRLLADRQNPDYRNSIKESISAVESLTSILTGKRKHNIGHALKELEAQGPLHGNMQKAFAALYGYTSDEGGIRHAMLAEPNVDAEDARFMLVACSAFCNYLIAKTAGK